MTYRLPPSSAQRWPTRLSGMWIAAAAVLLLTADARADEFSWNVAGGNWNLGGNWAPGGPPVAADNATISTSGTYTVALNDNRAITNLTINNATATLNHTAGTLALGGTVALTAGTYSLNGGTISGGSITSGGGLVKLQNSNGNILSDVAVGAGVLDFSAPDARVRLQGTTTLAAGSVFNLSNNGGNGNVLTFEQTATANGVTVNLTAAGAIVSVEGTNTLSLGPATILTHSSAGTSAILANLYALGGTATVLNQGLIRNTGSGILSINPSVFTNQSGGILRASAGTINVQRGGVINQPGGTFDVNGGTLSLNGTNWDNDGTITLSSGTLNLAGSFTSGGIGTLTRSGGVVNITGTMNNAAATLALNAATGTFLLNAGSITGGSVTAADGSRLQPQVSNANFLTDVAVGAGVIDFSVPAARLRLRGTTTLAAGTVLNLADGGGIGAVLAFEQTTTVNGVTVNLGPNTYLTVEGNNTLTLGPATTVTNSSNFGGAISSELFVPGTTAIINQGLISNTGNGSLLISGEAFTNQASGTVRATAGILGFSNTTNLTNFAGTTLTGGTWEVQGSATLDFGNRSIATLAAGTTVVFNGATPTFAALNSLTANNGTLRVLGGKSFTPTAPSVNNAGTLEVGAGSTFGKGVVVQSGGMLVGAGSVSGALVAESGGTVGPGPGPGILTVNNNVTLQPGSTLAVELNGTTAGTQYDRLAVNGAVDLGGANLAAVLGGGYTPAPGDALMIVMNDGVDLVTGQFAGLNQGATIPLGAYTGYLDYSGGTGNDVVIQFQPVPEPASIMAVPGLGLAAVGGWRRWRRQR